MRKLPAHALLVLMGLTIGLAQAQVTEPALRAPMEAMRSSPSPTIHGVRIAHAKTIYEFYSRRAFAPAWSDAHTASELRRALKDSEADGLDPGDYHLPLLDQLADPASADYEILHTDALLRIADHLSFGKVNPTTFDPHWNYGRADGLDLTREIDAMVAGNDIYAAIEKLKPTRSIYRKVKQELARFRLAATRTNWVTISPGQTIKPGAQDPRVPALRTRLAASGDLDPSLVDTTEIYDPALQAAVKRYQERMGLTADGTVGASTITELNVSLNERIQQLRINLDRGRVLLHDVPPDFVVVNIAAYWVYVVHGEDIVWHARAQVGKTFRRTPMFRSNIDHIVFNPTWTVPPGIIRNDILPAARKDPASITRRGLDVLDASGNKVDPQSIDWSKYKSGNIPYTLRQEPGPKNALGRVKFMFPNSYSVYLHDTPSSGLFESADRAFSSGCVRVDRPLELAVQLIGDPVKWNDASIQRTIDGGKTQTVNLANKVPVLLAYWTAWVDPQGRVNFRRDVYGQDAQWAKGLASTN